MRCLQVKIRHHTGRLRELMSKGLLTADKTAQLDDLMQELERPPGFLGPKDSRMDATDRKLDLLVDECVLLESQVDCNQKILAAIYGRVACLSVYIAS